MRYLPKSPAERQEMLAAIGAKSIDQLFSSIPERFRLREALNIPGPYSEAEVIQYFKNRAAENSNGYTSFLRGAVLERSEEHTSELQSRSDLVCRLLLEKKKKKETEKFKHDA